MDQRSGQGAYGNTRRGDAFAHQDLEELAYGKVNTLPEEVRHLLGYCCYWGPSAGNGQGFQIQVPEEERFQRWWLTKVQSFISDQGGRGLSKVDQGLG